MPETTEMRKIKKILGELGAKVIKVRGDGMQEVGTPDLIGSFRGRALALEVKYGRNKAEPIQLVRIGEWQRAGAIAGVVRNIDDVVQLLEKYDFECEHGQPMVWKREETKWTLECREC